MLKLLHILQIYTFIVLYHGTSYIFLNNNKTDLKNPIIYHIA